MKQIKKLFPMAFTLKTDLAALIVDIVIHLAIGLFLWMLADLILSLGTFGLVLCILLRLADVYLLISIILAILNYSNVIK